MGLEFYVGMACAAVVGLALFWAIPEGAIAWLTRRFIHSEHAKLLAGIAGFIAFAGVVFTVYQILIDLRDRADERVIRRDEAIARAWDRLLAPGVGNTGKGEALSMLVRERVGLDGVDLSCEALGNWDHQTATCRKPIIFAGVQLVGSPYELAFTGGSIAKVDMRHAELSSPVLTDFSLHGDFRNARASGMAIYGTVIAGAFDGATLTQGHVIASNLELDEGATPPTLEAVNVSGTRIGWIETLKPAELNRLFAWADMPPRRAIRLPIHVPLDNHGLFEDTNVGLDILRHIRLCKPPLDKKGNALPVALRIEDMGGAIITLPCEDMSAEAAMRRYPEAFAIKSPWRSAGGFGG